MKMERTSTPPMTDDEAKEILSRINNLGGATGIIATNRLMIGKLTDKIRRITLVFQILIAAIGSLSGIVGAILSPININLPTSATTVLFILSGIASLGTVAIPKLIDFLKRFSGRTYGEELAKWNSIQNKIIETKITLGDIQGMVLSMFGFIKPEKEFRDNESKRQQVRALSHFIYSMQSAQTIEQFEEAYNIVIPIFRIASTNQFISGVDMV